jgi:hypothetical protein
VLFIEVLRLYMNGQGEGRTGWLAGVGDRNNTAFSCAVRCKFGEPPALAVVDAQRHLNA